MSAIPVKTALLSRDQADAAAKRLRLFAQPQRLMILAALLEGERSVGEIEADCAIGQPALSQQLADLRKGAAVLARRQSKQVYYQLAGADIEHCVRSLCTMFGEPPLQTAPPQRDLVQPAARFAAA